MPHNPRITKIDMLQNAYDAAVDDFGIAVRDFRLKDSQYRGAKCTAYLFYQTQPLAAGEKPPTVDFIKALVDRDCVAEREAQRIAQGEYEACKELLEYYRVSISAQQSQLKFEGEIV